MVRVSDQHQLQQHAPDRTPVQVPFSSPLRGDRIYDEANKALFHAAVTPDGIVLRGLFADGRSLEFVKAEGVWLISSPNSGRSVKVRGLRFDRQTGSVEYSPVASPFIKVLERRDGSKEITNNVTRQVEKTPAFAFAGEGKGAGADLLPPPLRQLSTQELRRVAAHIQNLGSDEFEIREIARRQLLAMGPAILPHLRAGLASSDAEMVNATTAIFNHLAAPFKTRFDERAQTLLDHSQPRLSADQRQQFVTLVQTADAMSTDPGLAQMRLTFLQQLREAAISRPSITQDIDRSISELSRLPQLQVQLRVRFAEALMAGGEREPAIRLLTEALQRDNTLVRDDRFTKVLSGLDLALDSPLRQAFLAAGGNADHLVPRAELPRTVPNPAGKQDAPAVQAIDVANNPFSLGLPQPLLKQAALAVNEINRGATGPAIRQAYRLAEQAGPEQVANLIKLVNRELELRNSAYQIKDDTTAENRPGNRRTLTLHNAVGPLNTETFLIKPVPGRSEVVTGGEQLREIMRAQLPNFVSQEGTTDQQRAKREMAINQLNELLARHDKISAQQLLNLMVAANAVSNITDATSPATAATNLTKLIDSAKYGNHESQRVIDWLNQQLPPAEGTKRVEALAARLGQDGKTAEEALTQLKQALQQKDSPCREIWNQILTANAVVDLPVNPNLEQLTAARARLQAEIDQGNKQAQDSLSFVSSQRLLAMLANPKTAAAAMTELTTLARGGDTQARQAMAATLVSGNSKGRAAWEGSSRDLSTERTTMVPDLGGLSPEMASSIRLQAARALLDLTKAEGPTAKELSALALALADASDRRSQRTANDNDVQLASVVGERFQQIFTRDQKDCNQTEVALRALCDQICAGVPGSQSLAQYYILGASGESNLFLPWTTSGSHLREGVGMDFRDQTVKIKEAAVQGNQSALMILAAIAGGAGSKNTDANPQIRIERNGFGFVGMTPGDSLARNAQSTLMELAKRSPQVRDNVIAALTAQAHGLYTDTRFRLETLGQVAALNPKNIPDSVHAALQSGIASSDPQMRRSAIAGMMSIAPQLNPADLQAIAQNPSAEVSTFLASHAQIFSPQQGRQLMDLTRTGLLSGTAEHRLEAVRLMGAVGAFYANTEDIAAIRALGGSEALNQLQISMSPNYLHVTDALEQGLRDARELQHRAAEALLNICQRSNNASIQTASFRTFASTTWSIHMGGDALNNGHAIGSKESNDMRDRLIKVQKAHPENLSVQLGIARLMYGTERPPLAAIFRERGVPFSDAITNQRVQQAIANYGEPTVRAALDRVALFNSLQPEVRRQLSGSSGQLDPGQVFNFDGRVLEIATFNDLPPSARQAISGSPDALPLPATFDLSHRRISASTFNDLPPHLRRQIMGTDGAVGPSAPLLDPGCFVPAARLEGRSIDATTWNALPEKIRRDIAGDRGNSGLIPVRATWPDLGRAALSQTAFNSLPYNLRRALTGSDAALPPEQSLSLTGRTIDATTFNALPPAVRTQIAGSEQPLPPGESLGPEKLAGQSINAAAFNALSPEMRRQLTGSAADLPPKHTVSFKGQTIDAATFNQLPAQVRLELTGSAAPLPPDRVLRDLASVTLSADVFNHLLPSVRQSLTGRVDTVDLGQVLAQMANHTLEAPDSLGRFLMGEPPLDQAFAQLHKQAATDQEKAVEDLKALVHLRESMVHDFSRDSKETVGIINRARSLCGYPEVANFEAAQIKGIVNLQTVELRIRELEAQVRQRSAQAELLNLSQDNLRFSDLMQRGDIRQADILAMQLFARYGMQITQLAPDAAASLLSGGSQSGWARLHRAGLTLTSGPPTIEGATPAERSANAIEMLRKIHASTDAARLEQPRTEYVDAEVLRRTALAELDSSRELQHLFSAFRTVSEDSRILMVEGNAQGTRYAAFIQDARRRADAIEQNIKGITNGGELPQLIALRDSMTTALAVTGESAIKDQDARRALQQRLDALNQALQYFNPGEPNITQHRRQEIQTRLKNLDLMTNDLARLSNSDPKVRSEAYSRLEKQGIPLQQYYKQNLSVANITISLGLEWQQEQTRLKQELNGPNGYNRIMGEHGLLKIIRAPEWQEDTFKNWIKSDGPVILAGIVAAAAAIVAVEFLSAGTATPLVVAAVATAGGMLGSQVMTEIQCQNGLRTEGSLYGEWYYARSKIQNEDGTWRPREFWKDAAQPMAQEFVVQTLLNLATMGAGKFIGENLGAAFSKMTAPMLRLFVAENETALLQLSSRLTALEAQLAKNPAQRALAMRMMTRMLGESGNNALFATAQSTGELALHDLSHRLGLSISEANPAIGFITGVLLSAGHTAVHVRVSPHAHGTPTTPRGPNDPHIRMEFHAPTEAQEQQFFREAKLRGSDVQPTANGYREVTAEGLRVEYVRLKEAPPPENIHGQRGNSNSEHLPGPGLDLHASNEGRPVEAVQPRHFDPLFERDYSPKQVEDMARRFQEATKDWRDLTEEAKIAKPYFEAKRIYESHLGEQITNDIRQGMTPAEATAKALEAARNGDPATNPLRQERDRLVPLYEKYSREIEAVFGRQRMAQALMDRICNGGRFPDGVEQPVPGVKVIIVLELPLKAGGAYRPGCGQIRLLESDVLNAHGGGRLAFRMQHEFAHHRQDVAVVRSIGQLENVSHPPTPDQLQRVREQYKNRIGVPLDESFARKILDKTHPAFSQAEMEHAARLAESFKQQKRNQDNRDLLEKEHKWVLECQKATTSPTDTEHFSRWLLTEAHPDRIGTVLGKPPNQEVLLLMERARRAVEEKRTLDPSESARLHAAVEGLLANKLTELNNGIENCQAIYHGLEHEAEATEAGNRVKKKGEETTPKQTDPTPAP